MASEPQRLPHSEAPPGAVEMPRPTAAPMVLALGLVLLGAGVALGTAFLVVGAVVLVAGLGIWVANLLPGRGHIHESLVEPAQRSRPVTGVSGMVGQLRPGMVGYRVQLPEKVHPISAGVKGGMLGGLVIVLPAGLYGLVSGHGPWYPLNLLAGMVMPGLENMHVAELEQFRLSFLIAGILIHVSMCLVLGLMYGVLLPMLPTIPKPFAWSALLMPVLWTGLSFSMMRIVNPATQEKVNWPSFIFSQFIFGVVVGIVVMRARQVSPLAAGFRAGVIGGVLMLAPAALWGLASGNSIWYAGNLLAGMAQPHLSVDQLRQFQPSLFGIALTLHAIMSVSFGVAFALLLPKLPSIPGPMSWGALLMPVLWTGASYSLMGVVNPVLQQRVDWPWFVVSQFIFGLVASIVVVRTEAVAVPPVGMTR